MGTSASTQQDVSGVTSSSLPSHSLPSLSLPRPQYTVGIPLMENLESHNTNLLHHQVSIPSTDGYKWRKYGQKNVKGSEHPRNYYKCTFPGCTVKKYVEKYEEDGKLLDRISYKGGEHSHDPSRITRLNAADQSSFKQAILQENIGLPAISSDIVVKTEGRVDHPLEISVEPTPLAESPTKGDAFPASPRLVVETTADVDHNDDGYSWRKYGQKNVKGTASGNLTPRSYYRCTQEDCPVKKQVEQRGNSIFNTYEGTHNHLAPGWDEVNKKKKRKLNRPPFDRIPSHSKLGDLSELSDKNVEENEGISNKVYGVTPEETMSIVIAEAHHNPNVEVRTLIPLQELQTESNTLPSIDVKNDM